jgi:hypothetical protein
MGRLRGVYYLRWCWDNWCDVDSDKGLQWSWHALKHWDSMIQRHVPTPCSNTFTANSSLARGCKSASDLAPTNPRIPSALSSVINSLER